MGKRRTQLDIFYDLYKPIEENGQIKTYETIPEGVELNRVWTMLAGDSDKWYISSGNHIVNRIGYILTQKSHNFESKDYLYC